MRLLPIFILFACYFSKFDVANAYFCDWSSWSVAQTICLWHNKQCKSHLQRTCDCIFSLCGPKWQATKRGGSIHCSNSSCLNDYEYTEWQAWSNWNDKCPSSRTRKKLCKTVPLYDNPSRGSFKYCEYDQTDKDNSTRMCKTSWVVILFIAIGVVLFVSTFTSSLIRYCLIKRRAMRNAPRNVPISNRNNAQLPTVSRHLPCTGYVNHAMIPPNTNPPPYSPGFAQPMNQPTAPNYDSVMNDSNQPKDEELPSYEEALAMQNPPQT